MRIISGLFKGKKILQPKDSDTRPLKDLTKESIFNIIRHSKKFQIDLENSIILDLFSGVGSFGIECLSRGVKHVVFFENYKGVLPILKRNLKSLEKLNNYEIIEKDIYNRSTFLNLKKKFNIIYLDPPFKDKNLDKLLLSIKEEGILDKKGIIIIHRHKNEKVSFDSKFNIIEEKKYGISKIIFLNVLN